MMTTQLPERHTISGNRVYQSRFTVTTYTSAMAVFFSPGVYRVGGGVSVPKLITSTQPEYTAEARAARIEGTVELLFVIGQDGAPHSVQVQKALGFGLDEKAIECVARWRFNPGVYQDKPVPVAATLVVIFRLEPLLLK
jgi:TonB family protein